MKKLNLTLVALLLLAFCNTSIFLLILYLQSVLVNASCGAGCISCFQSIICMACAPNYISQSGSCLLKACGNDCQLCPGDVCTICSNEGYYPFGNACFSCKIEHCKTCTAPATSGDAGLACTECSDGYFNTESGCSVCAPNCSSCDEGVCTCASGEIAVANQCHSCSIATDHCDECTEITPAPIFGASKEGAFSAEISLSCTKCADDYKLSDGGECEFQGCQDGYEKVDDECISISIKKKGKNIGAIVGGTVGGAAFLLVATFVAIKFHSNLKKKKLSQSSKSAKYDIATSNPTSPEAQPANAHSQV